MQAPRPFELCVLRFLASRRRATWSDIREFARRLVRDNSVVGVTSEEDVVEYVKYLIARGFVEEHDGILELKIDKLPPVLRGIARGSSA